MRQRIDPKTERYLLLFKLDAKNLLDRIRNRRTDYVEIFALKRMRHHYAEIFWSRYDRATIHDLTYCGAETIAALDQFYKAVDELRWYLNHTDDMPKTIADVVEAKANVLHGLYDTLALYIDADMGIQEDMREEQAPKGEGEVEDEEQPAPWDTHDAELFAEIDPPQMPIEVRPEEVFEGAKEDPKDEEPRGED